MNELYYKTLSLISNGLLILDSEHNIVFFNRTIENLCNIQEKNAVGKKIEDVLPVFAGSQYKTMIDTVLETGQSRFCSSALHKSFVFPKGENRNLRRQNMRMEFLSDNDKQYVVMQIIDISDTYKNEIKLKNNILKLKKGFDDLNFTKETTEKLAKYDTLTGLLNRCYFDMKISEMVKEAEESSNKFAMLFIDVDGFKKVNDTYGHMIGDGLLQIIAARIKNNINNKGYIMRLGGDEFVVAQKDIISENNIRKLADNLLETIRRPYYIDGKTIKISASIGISIYPEHSRSLDELIDKADKAMYFSKRNGKNRAQLYSVLL